MLRNPYINTCEIGGIPGDILSIPANSYILADPLTVISMQGGGGGGDFKLCALRSLSLFASTSARAN